MSITGGWSKGFIGPIWKSFPADGCGEETLPAFALGGSSSEWSAA